MADALASTGNAERGLQILAADQGGHGPSIRIGIDRRRIDLRLQAGQWTEAEEELEAAFRLAEQVDDQEEEARLHYLHARCALKQSDLVTAEKALHASDEAAQQVNQPRFHQRILASLAKVQRQAGRHDDALATMTRWVGLLKELGDRHEQLRVLGDMGQVKIDQGD